MGWETANLYSEWAGGKSTEGRESEKQVVLEPRLLAALRRLNPGLPANALDQAVEEVTRDRSRMVSVNANHELWRLMREGVKVNVTTPRGGQETKTARIIDWRNPAANDFLLASQFWVRGEMHRRRPDLIGFVTGLPLGLRLNHVHQMIIAAMATAEAKFAASLSYLVAMRRQSLRRQNARSILLRCL